MHHSIFKRQQDNKQSCCHPDVWIFPSYLVALGRQNHTGGGIESYWKGKTSAEEKQVRKKCWGCTALQRKLKSLEVTGLREEKEAKECLGLGKPESGNGNELWVGTGPAGVSQGMNSQCGHGDTWTGTDRHSDTLKGHEGPGPVSKAAQHWPLYPVLLSQACPQNISEFQNLL